jgi:hypothetical protein
MFRILNFFLIESNTPFLILVTFFLLQYFFLILGNTIFVLRFLSGSIDKIFCKDFQVFLLSIPFSKKIVFLFFLVFFAIPNKIWVNNKMGRFVHFFLHFFTYLLSIMFPLFILVFLLRLLYVLDSLLFNYCFEYLSIFKRFILNYVFVNDEIFCQKCVTFFYGDAPTGVRTFFSMGIPAFIFIIFYWNARLNENKYVNNLLFSFTKEKLEEYYSDPQNKALNMDEIILFEKKIRQDIIISDTVILKTETKILEIINNLW